MRASERRGQVGSDELHKVGHFISRREVYLGLHDPNKATARGAQSSGNSENRSIHLSRFVCNTPASTRTLVQKNFHFFGGRSLRSEGERPTKG